MRRKISQSDARLFRKKFQEKAEELRTLRKLKFALFVIPDDSKDSVTFRAIRSGE